MLFTDEPFWYNIYADALLQLVETGTTDIDIDDDEEITLFRQAFKNTFGISPTLFENMIIKNFHKEFQNGFPPFSRENVVAHANTEINLTRLFK